MSYAIVATSGTQVRVEPGRFYDVNRLAVDENEAITLEQVLFVNNDGEWSVGQPLVEGASVQATVMRHLRGRKIIVYKMRPKKKTRKKQGHRQELTRIMINSITLGDNIISAAGSPTSVDDPAVVSEAAVETEVAPSAEASTSDASA